MQVSAGALQGPGAAGPGQVIEEKSGEWEIQAG